MKKRRRSTTCGNHGVFIYMIRGASMSDASNALSIIDWRQLETLDMVNQGLVCLRLL